MSGIIVGRSQDERIKDLTKKLDQLQDIVEGLSNSIDSLTETMDSLNSTFTAVLEQLEADAMIQYQGMTSSHSFHVDISGDPLDLNIYSGADSGPDAITPRIDLGDSEDE